MLIFLECVLLSPSWYALIQLFVAILVETGNYNIFLHAFHVGLYSTNIYLNFRHQLLNLPKEKYNNNNNYYYNIIS